MLNMEPENLQLCPSVLGLKRVGALPEVKKKPDLPILNKRGVLIRDRKRNSLFFGNEMFALDEPITRRSSMRLKIKSKPDVSKSPKITNKKKTGRVKMNLKSQSILNVSAKLKNRKHNSESNLISKPVLNFQSGNIAPEFNNCTSYGRTNTIPDEPEIITEETVIKEEPFDAFETINEPIIDDHIDIKEENMSSDSQNEFGDDSFAHLNEFADNLDELSEHSVYQNENTIAKDLETKLRNLLKSPKAYNWICSEFFYSVVDKPIFQYSDNDFIICLKESFPALKNYNLTRTEWNIIRRLLGKPRRCSSTFYKEEQIELNRRRSSLRLLQRGKMETLKSIKDIPNKIPLSASVDDRVTARMYHNQNGLFTGTVEYIDDVSNSLAVKFDINLSVNLVPDYDILFNDNVKCISKRKIIHLIYRLSKTGSHKFAKKLMREFKAKEKKLNSARQMNTIDFKLNDDFNRSDSPAVSSTTKLLSNILCSSQLSTPPHLINMPLTNSPKDSTNYNNNDLCANDCPIDVMEHMVQLNKLLYFKKLHIKKLEEMNTCVERAILYERGFSAYMEMRYANVVIILEMINHNLLRNIKNLNNGLQRLVPMQILSSILTPVYLQDHSLNVAKDLVEKVNRSMSADPVIKDNVMLAFISDITSLLLQIKSLTEYRYNDYEIDVLGKSIERIKSKLSSNNRKVFENYIEIHMQHIQILMIGKYVNVNSSSEIK